MGSPKVLAAAIIALVFLNIADGARLTRQASRCNLGVPCVPLSSCPAMQSLLRDPNPINLAQLSRALCQNRPPMVCCDPSATVAPTAPPLILTPTEKPNPSPGSSKEALLPARCGIDTTDNRIFNGETVSLAGYPWMAVFGYRVAVNAPLKWGCGGALINNRYIVTAAHCVTPELPLEEIRIGDHDLTTNPDCVLVHGLNHCAPRHQSFKIRRSMIISHPDYNTRSPVSDDIALIRLDRPAAFNQFVHPICLPESSQFNVRSFLNNREAVVAGWGATETGSSSTVLKRTRIPLVNLDTCQPFYENKLVPEQLCFGGQGGRDSCTGDSGGPVFQADGSGLKNTLIGVVSFGGACGGNPAIYTSIPSYRNWILDNMEA